jgi:hypothetical protein
LDHNRRIEVSPIYEYGCRPPGWRVIEIRTRVSSVRACCFIANGIVVGHLAKAVEKRRSTSATDPAGGWLRA